MALSLSVLQVPEESDVDQEQADDCLMSPEYTKDIFVYLRNREVRISCRSVQTLCLRLKYLKDMNTVMV